MQGSAVHCCFQVDQRSADLGLENLFTMAIDTFYCVFVVSSSLCGNPDAVGTGLFHGQQVRTQHLKLLSFSCESTLCGAVIRLPNRVINGGGTDSFQWIQARQCNRQTGEETLTKHSCLNYQFPSILPSKRFQCILPYTAINAGT